MLEQEKENKHQEGPRESKNYGNDAVVDDDIVVEPSIVFESDDPTRDK